jgi:hypothetical protein
MGMNRKHVRRLVAGLVAVTALVSVIYIALQPRTITQKVAARIQPGMTMTEVQELLGRPPDQDGPYESKWLRDEPNSRRLAVWQTPDMVIWVHHEDSSVTDSSYLPRVAETLWQRFRRRNGLN